MVNLFKRLDAGRPAPVEEKIEPQIEPLPLPEKKIEPPPIESIGPPTEEWWPPPRKVDHAQKLLDWLQRWDKPTVTARDIRIFGPHSGRTREITYSSIELLVRHGWLVPFKLRGTRRRRWRIVRKRPVAHPNEAD